MALNKLKKCPSDKVMFNIIGRWETESERYYVQFNTNGTCNFSDESGTYQILDDKTLTVQRDGYSQTDKVKYNLDGDKLIIGGRVYNKFKSK